MFSTIDSIFFSYVFVIAFFWWQRFTFQNIWAVASVSCLLWHCAFVSNVPWWCRLCSFFFLCWGYTCSWGLVNIYHYVINTDTIKNSVSLFKYPLRSHSHLCLFAVYIIAFNNFFFNYVLNEYHILIISKFADVLFLEHFRVFTTNCRICSLNRIWTILDADE